MHSSKSVGLSGAEADSGRGANPRPALPAFSLGTLRRAFALLVKIRDECHALYQRNARTEPGLTKIEQACEDLQLAIARRETEGPPA